ncbi:MAG TPA: BamA/TamA family outer membrane protein [Cyclobacteriaceae bacterium]|mgnify:CR=1 FL=1|nr:BamA/TamA family outer membrane protein [Cyclobacteriaceae bacterium]
MLTLKGKFRYFLTASLLSMLFSGCLGTRYLEPGEKLLFKQKVVVPKGFKKDGMSDLYIQKTNRRLLGLPINSLVWMYHIGKNRYNPEKFKAKKEKIETKFNRKITNTKNESKKSSLQYRKQNKIDVLNGKIENGNLFMQWGEEAAVYDSSNIALTAEKLTDYLFTRGYFEATADIEKSEKGKKVSINYHVNPKAAYFYDSITYQIEDQKIKSLYEKNLNSSLIKKGDQFNQNVLNQERERIDNLLKDNGYYAFGRDYVEFDIDSTYGGYHKIALRLNILNPANLSSHKQYRIDSIIFITDANTTNTTGRSKRQIVPYRGISYQYYRNEYSKRILSQRIFFNKDSLYSRSGTINTQRQLANLGMFKFVNVNYDSSGGQFVAYLYTSALNRYSWSNEAGLTVTQGFPGPYYNMSFLKRNLFGGIEIFELNGRAGFEGVASATDKDFYRSVEAGLNATITFPQFLIPMSREAQNRIGKLNPKTKILGGFTYSQRPEYERETTTFSYTYSWEKRRTTQYSFTLANLNIIQSRLDSTFRALLNDLSATQGNNIRLSFNPSFVSSMIFSMTWNPENYGNTTSNSKFIRAQAESGGTFLKIYTPGIIEKENLQLFRYLRLNIDYRKNRILNSNSVLAYRINTGIGWSYSEDRVLPYEKYFFAGGSNSVRAWRPRRLGVGSVPPLLSTDTNQDGLFDYSFEKPGEILLEGSVELRRKLFGFVNGALFVDWGNVWSFNENQLVAGSSEPNVATWKGSTQFRLDNFYNQIAVGTGFGLRFDFSFLVLRFDVGIKVHDPAREEGDRFVLDDLKFFRPFGGGKEPVIYNIGIGYPF